MNKLGIQFQFDASEALRYNREVRPSAWMAINVVKPEFLAQMVSDNPNAIRIFRHYPNRPWADDPERRAREAVQHIAGMMGSSRRFFTHVTDNNEFILGPDHVPRELIERADRYISTFIATARAEFGLGTCWGNFNVGHWGGGPTGGREIIDYFPLSLAAAQYDGNSPICFHAYNWRTLRDDTHSYTGKFVKAMPAILEQYPDVSCMVTELGIDRPSREWGADHEGWRMAFADLGQAVDMFCGDQGLRWISDLANQYDWMLGLLIFGCGMVEPWRPQGFDIMNDVNDTAVMDRIKLLEGGDTMDDPKVIDFEYQERDFEFARSKYGAAFRRAEVAEGEPVYRLVELWEKTGDTALIAKVLDEDGNPLENVRVTFYWPDAPEFPHPSEYDWYRNFTVGSTDVGGDGSGGSMGHGAYVGEGECGPHAVWVHDPEIPSDVSDCHGMIAGMYHDHLNPRFKLMVGTGDIPERGDYEDLVWDFEEGTANAIHVVAQDRNFHGTRARIGVQYVIIDDEEVESSWHAGPFYPASLTRHELDASYTLVAGETARMFWVTIERTTDGVLVGGPYFCKFETGTEGIWTIEVGEVEEPPPPAAWTMTVERRASPGLRLLVGIGLPNGTVVTVSAPWGHAVDVVAGSKSEWGAGGWELPIWHAATYTLSLLDEEFTVDVGDDEIAICTFEEGEPPESRARLITDWMDEDDAEELLERLEDSDFQDVFELELETDD